MSVTVVWRAIPKDEGTALHGFFGSTALQAIRDTFNDRGGRVRLTRSDVVALRAMAAVAPGTAYDELAHLIETHGEIEVWGEW